MNDGTDSKTDPPAPAPQPEQPGFLSPFNQALADQARPIVRRLEELLPDIESAMAKGYTRQNIVEALKAGEGIEISVATLSVYLQRLRQRRRPAAAAADADSATAPTKKQALGGTRK
jgi:hypothetical protein